MEANSTRRRKRMQLLDSEAEEHAIEFDNGRATAVICPKVGRCEIRDGPNNPAMDPRKESHLDSDVTKHVSGKRVSHVTHADKGSLAIRFTDGSALVVERHERSLAARFEAAGPLGEFRAGAQPTPRQREYLEFIKKYILRFGIAPAESDIQRHFLVAAPSVNQMVRSLERRGFITREPGVPRSIRIVEAP
jgi:repressor LexA